MQVDNIGKTAVGREISALTLYNKKCSFFEKYNGPVIVGTINGNDVNICQLIINLIKNIQKSVEKNTDFCDVNYKSFLKKNCITFIPLLNADGFEISKKGMKTAPSFNQRREKYNEGDLKNRQANARGVDLKYNFPFMFEITKKKQNEKGIFTKNSYGYCGEHPISEPETESIIRFCKKNNFSVCISLFEGSGNIFWYSKKGQNDRSKQIANVLSCVSGYKVEAEFGSTSFSGLRNWFNNEFNRPAIDIVLDTNQTDMYKSVEELLVTATVM